MSLNKFLKRAREIDENKDLLFNKAKKKQLANHDESNWLISYADIMTLLCAFFIMLFSLSTLSKPEYERVRIAMANHFGGKYISPAIEYAQFLTQLIQEKGIEKHAVVETNSQGVVIVFESIVFFDGMASLLRDSAIDVLDSLVDSIRDREEKIGGHFKFIIEGHTDMSPVVSGKYPSNWELSSARASNVAKFFIDRGISEQQVVPIGFGSTRPNTYERSPAGALDPALQSKNRRVIVRILDPAVDHLPWEDYSVKSIGDSQKTRERAEGLVEEINSSR